MKKTILKSVMVALGVLLSVHANADENGVLIEGVYYNLVTASKTATVTNGSTAYTGAVTIPATVIWDGVDYNVTSISMEAFKGCGGLTSVSIPGSVAKIGDQAFYNCSGLTSVTIPDGVTSIGNEAFRGCSNLATVVIGDDVKTIGYNAFYNCRKLAELTFGKRVESIGAWAFYDCDGLKSVTIPRSVTYFGDQAFRDCTYLTAVHITDLAAWCGVKAGDDYANPLDVAQHLYLNGAEVKDLVIPDGVKTINNLAFKNCQGLRTVTIPKSVTNINHKAFYNCDNLNTVNIEGNGTDIASSAFADCNYLNTLNISGSIASFGEYAFNGCNNLNKLDITDLAAWCKMRFGATKASPFFYAKTMKLNGESVTDLVFPEGISTIGAYAFAEYKGLKSVMISNDVTSIAEGAFQGCTGLKDVTIGNSVTSVGQYAFRNCTGMQNLVVGNSVNSIGDVTFGNCGDLRSIVVVKGNSKYDSRDNCNAIIVTNTNTLLRGCRKTVIPEGIKTIGYYAFENCKGLAYINIPNSVTYIDSRAFSDSDLKELEIHCNKAISDTFYDSYFGSTTLEKVILGSEVKTLDRYGGGHVIYGPNLSTVVSYIQEPFSFNNNIYFNNTYNTCKLIVPAGTRDAYIAKGWTESVFKGGVVEMDPNSLAVADQSANCGKSVTIPIEMNNVDAITAFQFEVVLPEGITWASCKLTDRKEDHVLSAKKQANGIYVVTAISMGDENFSGNSGAVANLTLDVADDEVPGLYRVQIRNIELTTEEGEAAHPIDVNATLAIKDFTMGDTNGDGDITITDAVNIIKLVLSGETSFAKVRNLRYEDFEQSE